MTPPRKAMKSTMFSVVLSRRSRTEGISPAWMRPLSALRRPLQDALTKLSSPRPSVTTLRREV